MLEAAGQDRQTPVTRSHRGLLPQDGTYLEPTDGAQDTPEDIINNPNVLKPEPFQHNAMDGQSLWNMPIATTRYPRFGIGKKVPLLGLDQITSARHFRRGGPFWRAKRSDKDSMLWSSDDGDGWMLFLANQTPFYVSKKLLSHQSI